MLWKTRKSKKRINIPTPCGRGLTSTNALKESGFSLIEALVSAAIFGLGFVGVYTIVATSEQTMVKSMQRSQAQMIADQIVDVISTDIDNLDSYEMDLSDCTAPVTADQWDVRGYEWCIRLNDTLGPARASDTRSISVDTIDDDPDDERFGLRILTILIEGNNQNVQIVMKRTFDD